MVKKSSIHAKIDSQVKKEAIELFNELGIDLTTAINIFLRQSIRENGIPFNVNRMNKDTLDAISDFESGTNLKEYDSVGSMLSGVLDE